MHSVHHQCTTEQHIFHCLSGLAAAKALFAPHWQDAVPVAGAEHSLSPQYLLLHWYAAAMHSKAFKCSAPCVSGRGDAAPHIGGTLTGWRASGRCTTSAVTRKKELPCKRLPPCSVPYAPGLAAAVALLAPHIGARWQDVVPVVNATSAINAVARCVALRHSDMILIASTTYPAVRIR